MNLGASLFLSLAIAASAAGVPWVGSGVNRWYLTGALAVGLTFSGIIAGVPLAAYPWTDLVVLLVSLSAGILLGRSLSQTAWPMLVLLVVLSALDVAQIVLTSHSPSPSRQQSIPPPGQLVGNFFLALPAGHFNIGIFDIFTIAAISEHWRRRGACIYLAEAPGIIGLILAFAFLWLAYEGSLPLIPFLLLGWLCSVLLSHVHRRDR